MADSPLPEHSNLVLLGVRLAITPDGTYRVVREAHTLTSSSVRAERLGQHSEKTRPLSVLAHPLSDWARRGGRLKIGDSEAGPAARRRRAPQCPPWVKQSEDDGFYPGLVPTCRATSAYKCTCILKMYLNGTQSAQRGKKLKLDGRPLNVAK